ncbi:MAG TPA: hypothetical protein DCL54_10275 [Alphaproteobacteria bacterium]|nr:hypothetical protein [Alphaproteobacteria bacterium]HAJ46953.1 hypothetical protein [Alphaproteobacteria bacterium]
MGMIQIRNVPPDLHKKLKAKAAKLGMSLSDFLLREAERAADLVTPEELRERLDRLEAYRGKESPTDALRAEREGR